MWHLDDPGAAEHGCHGKRVHGAPHLVSLLYVRCTHVNFWILEIQLVREVCTPVREVFEARTPAQLDDRDSLKLWLAVERSRSGPSPPLKDVSIQDAILGERYFSIPNVLSWG